VGRKALAQPREQRVVAAGRQHADLHAADLAPARVVSDLAPERLGQQLVAVADAEHRHPAPREPAEPLAGALAPGLPVGQQRRRARHHHPRERAVLGQRLAAIHPPDLDALAREPEPARDPVLEVAAPRHDLRQRLAGLDDRDRPHAPSATRPS
jgi:hypothetical protein